MQIKQSDVWLQTTFGSVFDFKGGTQPAKEEFIYSAGSGYTRLLQIRDFEHDERPAYIKDTFNGSKCAETDILIARYGASLGRILTGKSGYYNVALVKLISNDAIVDRGYAFHWLQSDAFQARLKAVGNRSAQAGFNKQDLADCPILLPPLAEQRRLAEVLRSVDETVSMTDAAVSATTSVRQNILDALIRDLIESLDGVTCDLSQAAEVRTGLAKNKNASGRHICLPYLRVANVQDGWFDLSDMQEISVEPDKVWRYALQSGDVLLTEGGDYDKLGRGGVWKGQVEPCLHQNHIFCVRPDPELLLSEFLALLTQSFLGRSYFLSCAKRTTNLASINSSQLKSFPVPLPDLGSQERIIDEIGSIDAVIEREQKKRQTLARIRSGLFDDLFSGRVRVLV
jgi:type I restriction enzyme S subunit